MAIIFYNTGEEHLRAGTMGVIQEITSGWWSDIHDNPVNIALLSDIVRFHIRTKGLSNGSQVAITIMDDDGVFNLDDEILSTSITINDNKGYMQIKLERSWLHYIDSDAGNEVELYAICKYQNISKELPASSDSYLNVYSVGYIAYDDCRIRIRDNGNIEFWSEHFSYFARNQWDTVNYPYKQGMTYIDTAGNQHIGGIPTKLDYIVDPDYVLPLDYEKYTQNLRDRDLPEIENNTPRSPVNGPPTRRDRKQYRRTGGIVRPPVGTKGGAAATLILDAVIMMYDIITPSAVNAENENIRLHYDILVNNVIKDINDALQCGIINDELAFRERCQLVSVVLYGGDTNVSDKIYEIGCDVYEFISNFKKRKS